MRHERPERPTPADQEERGEGGEHRHRGHCHAHRPHRAEPGRRVDGCERQAEQSRDDGARGGQDPGTRLPHRDAHGLVLVLVAVKLLAVAGGEEERVVGSGAEDEDEEDATGLAVDDDARVDE